MVSRRELLKMMSAAAALPAWLSEPAIAGMATPLIRYSASGASALAKAAIDRYRTGVAALKKLPDYDPRSWVWQANIHGWPGQILPNNAPNRDAEFERVFETGPILSDLTADERRERRNLAEATWGKCPHGTSDFLPWHRCYLYMLERLLQDAVGDEQVSVPYWDWHRFRFLPSEFRVPSIDGQPNALFFDRRNPNVNNSTSPAELIEYEVRYDSLSEACFDQFLEPDCAFTIEGGFGPSLENNSHRLVHGFVGGIDGMGYFEMAARDPIFFAHHANVDRLWASWSDAPSNNEPSTTTRWLETKHTLIDVDGSPKELTNSQLLKASMILERGYVYDILESTPPVQVAATPVIAGEAIPKPAGEQRAIVPQLVASAKDVDLAPSAVNAILDFENPNPVTASELAGGMRRHVLILSDLTFGAGPQDNYMVFLNLPEGLIASPKSKNLVKIISLFVMPHKMTGEDGRTHGGEIQIDVTESIKNLAQSGELENLRVTIAPVRGHAVSTEGLRIGSVRLLSQ